MLAKMLSRNRDIVYFGESRFLIDNGGVYDAITGNIDKDEFEKKILGSLRLRIIGSLKNQKYDAENLYTKERMGKIFDTCFVSPKISIDCASIFVRCIYELGLSKFKGNNLLEKTPHTNIIAKFLPRSRKRRRNQLILVRVLGGF